MSDLKERILKVIKPNQLSVLATVSSDGKPFGRYMMCTGNDDLSMVCVTGLSSRKVQHIRENQNVHVTLGFKPPAMGPWVQYAGTAEILTDKASREQFWDEMLKQYFKGPDDPEYCIIRIVPQRIEYWAGMEPEVWEE